MSADDEQERLLRALRAPGSDAELSEEERYRAMFRSANSPAAPAATRRSRASRRLLAGGTAAVVVAVGTGGVAAAYSGRLPSPIQTFAHHVIGAPEASRVPSTATTSTPRARTTGPAEPRTTGAASPTGRPTPRSSRPPRPTAPAPAASATPSESATTSSSPRPTSSPSPTNRPVAVLTGVTMAGDSHRAAVGTQVRFSGRLTYSAPSTSRRRVMLQQHEGGRWTAVRQGRSAADGSFVLTAPALDRTRGFRVVARAGGSVERSAPWRVAMRPLVTADVTSSTTEATIRVSALGGVRGDLVTLLTRRDGRVQTVGRARLDAAGTASFTVTPDRRRTSYAVVLAQTKQHTAARTKVGVTPAR